MNILGKNEVQNDNNSVIIDINRKNGIYQIELANQMKKGFIKLDNSIFCYEFDSNNIESNLETRNEMNSGTIVIKNNLNNSNNNN